MAKIRILLADDHELIRTGVRNLIGSNKDFQIVGESADGMDTLTKTRDLRPDVVVIDISMPKLSGIEAARRICDEMSSVKVLVLTMHENAEYVYQILKSGASGYVLKNAGKEEITEAIYAVTRGDKFFSPRISELMISEYVKQAEQRDDQSGRVSLTKREQEILRLIAGGLNNQQIAGKLFISPRTVDTHRTNIMQKLNIHDAANLMRYALEHGYGSDV
ncbi:MAG: response regulator transcription factor [Ignavibacteriales bacterium]|nr:response regulator transcription factor [Ignavibacteriales bacterium]